MKTRQKSPDWMKENIPGKLEDNDQSSSSEESGGLLETSDSTSYKSEASKSDNDDFNIDSVNIKRSCNLSKSSFRDKTNSRRIESGSKSSLTRESVSKSSSTSGRESSSDSDFGIRFISSSGRGTGKSSGSSLGRGNAGGSLERGNVAGKTGEISIGRGRRMYTESQTKSVSKKRVISNSMARVNINYERTINSSIQESKDIFKEGNGNAYYKGMIESNQNQTIKPVKSNGSKIFPDFYYSSGGLNGVSHQDDSDISDSINDDDISGVWLKVIN